MAMELATTFEIVGDGEPSDAAIAALARLLLASVGSADSAEVDPPCEIKTQNNGKPG